MITVRIEIPIDEEAAIGLSDPSRLEAVGPLVSHMLRPTTEHNLLAACSMPPARRRSNPSLPSTPSTRR